MKNGAVIYTRTANFDYSHDFAICPDEMQNREIYHKYCTDVFTDVTPFRRKIRFMIGNRSGCLCGIATVSTEVLSEDDDRVKFRYVDDCREYRFLCGIYSEKPFLPSIDNLIDIYCSETERIWNLDTHFGSVEPLSERCNIANDASDAEREWASRCSRKMNSILFGKKIRCYTFCLSSEDQVPE